MTPTQWIEQMGAGWNLGNTLECYAMNLDNIKWRYWGSKGNWTYDILHDGESIQTSQILPIKRGVVQNTTISFTAPEDGIVDIVLSHPVIKTGIATMKFNISVFKVDNTVVVPLIDNFVFPQFSDYNSSLTVDLSTITSETVANKTVEFTLLIDRELLPQYPTNDETVLSTIRSWWNTYSISAWGSRIPKETHIKAVAAVGFKSIRIPISWKDHIDYVDATGAVHVDTEFLNYLANLINMCHTYGLSVVINMHHDDQNWLKTGTYLTDPTKSVCYKSIWAQIADYFKDYGDWLAFASNNETRNNAGTWEGAGVTSADIYGLMQIQQDFYDVVRNSGGNNATRICMYPTYAAKIGYLIGTYKNPDDETDMGKWHLPNNDPYGIAEVHPYSASRADIQKYVKYAITNGINRGIPIVYGEFGVNASQMTDYATCQTQTYTVAYAKYNGIGTYVWDDGGGMQILKKDKCKMNNSDQFDKLWNGFMNNYVPSLTACASLRENEILLGNRRNSCYVGDTVSIYLDTDEQVIISNEGSGDVELNGNTFTAASEGIIDNLLAISYSGEYGLIDVTVERPQNWTLTLLDDTSNWEHYAVSRWPSDHFLRKESNTAYSIIVPITSACVEIQGVNTTKSIKPSKPLLKMRFIQADSNNNLLTFSNGSYLWETDENTPPERLSPLCTQLAVMIITQGTFVDVPIAEGTWAKINQRDMNTPEEKDLTDSYVDSIMDYSNFNASLYRTINVSGGMEYQLDLGDIDCDVYVREFNGDKLEAEYWLENGDTFTTNLFTKTMRIEIVVPNANINAVISAMNNGALRPTLSYTDYATHQSEYNEEFTPIPVAEPSNKMVGIGNRVLTYNGKVVKL